MFLTLNLRFIVINIYQYILNNWLFDIFLILDIFDMLYPVSPNPYKTTHAPFMINAAARTLFLDLLWSLYTIG